MNHNISFSLYPIEIGKIIEIHVMKKKIPHSAIEDVNLSLREYNIERGWLNLEG